MKAKEQKLSEMANLLDVRMSRYVDTHSGPEVKETYQHPVMHPDNGQRSPDHLLYDDTL